MSQILDFSCPTRIVAGPGALELAAAMAVGKGARRVLILADADLVASGRVTAVATTLEQSGLGVIGIADPVAADGSVEASRQDRSIPDLLVLIGGDAPFVLAGALHGDVPAIGLPTVAASGQGQTRCGTLVLDPDHSVDVPDAQAASAAIVAIGNAIESWVAARRNPLTDMFARESWRRLSMAYSRAIDGTADADALMDVLLGTFLAATAACQSGLGAVHACAEPLIRRGHVDRAAATAILLPEVVRFNSRVVADRYAELASVRGEARRPEILVARLEDFAAAGGFPPRLASTGLMEGDLPTLAEQAAKEPSAINNPRTFDVASALELYAATY